MKKEGRHYNRLGVTDYSHSSRRCLYASLNRLPIVYYHISTCCT